MGCLGLPLRLRKKNEAGFEVRMSALIITPEMAKETRIPAPLAAGWILNFPIIPPPILAT